jgi:hypothetical protein
MKKATTQAVTSAATYVAKKTVKKAATVAGDALVASLQSQASSSRTQTGPTRPAPSQTRPFGPGVQMGPQPSMTTQPTTRPPPGKTFHGKKRYARLCEEDRDKFKQFRARAKWLDGKYTCCFCMKVGVDPLLGIIPIVGDFIGAILSVMLILQATHAWKLPNELVMSMFLNVALDAIVSIEKATTQSE